MHYDKLNLLNKGVGRPWARAKDLQTPTENKACQFHSGIEATNSSSKGRGEREPGVDRVHMHQLPWESCIGKSLRELSGSQSPLYHLQQV